MNSDNNQDQTVTVKGSNNIVSLFEDNSGGLSSTRILMLTWGIGTFLIWGFATVMAVIHGVYTFPTIPESVVTILIGTTGCKVAQRFGEK